ncbi:MAG: hypothetical protein IPN55_17320 [Saprospiraceae bacterium]|nr:hypothetical protein [Candidatus Brachybacter algidus]
MLELAKVWRANHPGFSARTLFYSILNQGIYLGVGINRFERWVAEAGMNVRKSRPQVPKQVMEKEENISQPDKWFSIKWNKPVDSRGHYILYGRWNMAFYFCLKDVYSQFILCLLPSKKMKAEQAVASLKDALA